MGDTSKPSAVAAPARWTGRRLARWSWLIPLAIFFSTFAVRMALGPLVADLLGLALALSGLLLAVLAFLRIRREGEAGILTPAVVGFLLNGAMILIWVTNFLAMRERLGQQ